MRWADFNRKKVPPDQAALNILEACTRIHDRRYPTSKAPDHMMFSCEVPTSECVDLKYPWHAGEHRGDLCRAPIFFVPRSLEAVETDVGGVCPRRSAWRSALPPQVSRSDPPVATLKGHKVRVWLSYALHYAWTHSESPVVRCMAYAYLYDKECPGATTDHNLKLAGWLLDLLEKEQPWRG